MATEREGRAKTQTLSLRLDPKTRFILEFMSRVRGQSITVVVERAIKEAAAKTGIGSNEEMTWTDFWDSDESIRTLNLLAHPAYQTTYAEDEIRRFTLEHWEFFYTDPAGKFVRRGLPTVLWPNLQKYLQTWNTMRSENYWAAGKQMAEDLSRAGLSPPTWPRPAKPDRKQNFARDLDDEVPF